MSLILTKPRCLLIPGYLISNSIEQSTFRMCSVLEISIMWLDIDAFRTTFREYTGCYIINAPTTNEFPLSIHISSPLTQVDGASGAKTSHLSLKTRRPSIYFPHTLIIWHPVGCKSSLFRKQQIQIHVWNAIDNCFAGTNMSETIHQQNLQA